MIVSTSGARKNEFSEVSNAVNHNTRLINNWEKKIRHDELVKDNKKHEWGVRKKPFCGHEFYLIEENKISFKEAFKHPSHAIARLMEIIRKIESMIYQLINIDTSVRKKAAYVKSFESNVQADIDGLSTKYRKLRIFGERMVGNSEAAAHEQLQRVHAQVTSQLATARLRINELEHAGSHLVEQERDHLRHRVDALINRTLELEQLVTRHAILNEDKDRTIALLKNTKKCLQNEIEKQLHTIPKAQIDHDDLGAEHKPTLFEELKEAIHNRGKHDAAVEERKNEIPVEEVVTEHQDEGTDHHLPEAKIEDLEQPHVEGKKKEHHHGRLHKLKSVTHILKPRHRDEQTTEPTVEKPKKKKKHKEPSQAEAVS